MGAAALAAAAGGGGPGSKFLAASGQFMIRLSVVSLAAVETAAAAAGRGGR